MALERAEKPADDGGAEVGDSAEMLLFRAKDLHVSLRTVASLEAGSSLAFGTARTPLGPCSIGVLGEALAWLAFGESASPAGDHERLRRNATTLAPPATNAWVEKLFGVADAPLAIVLVGSPFQLRVWRALLSVPFGVTTTYGDLANAIENSGAARAVGRAVGANPIAVVVPCHRVVRGDGALGGYRWGTTLKQRLLAAEGVAFAI